MCGGQGVQLGQLLPRRDEESLARRLLLLRPGMLVLLARARSTRNPPVLAHLPDGSYLSRLDGLAVRIIDADLQMTGSEAAVSGTATG